MGQSLHKLMDNLCKTTKPSDMHIINECRASQSNDGKLDIEKRDLQLSKGIVPWTLVEKRRDLKILRRTLPKDKKYYYSVLTEDYPEDEDLERAGRFYQKYQCRNLLEYIMQYCEADVVQLAQCFHSFRMKIFNFAKIDVLKFVGLASCAFTIFQKLSKCSVGLVSDEKILALLLQGIRGGEYPNLKLFLNIVHMIIYFPFTGLSFIGERVKDFCPKHFKNLHGLYADANNLVCKNHLRNFSIIFLNFFLTVWPCSNI